MTPAMDEEPSLEGWTPEPGATLPVSRIVDFIRPAVKIGCASDGPMLPIQPAGLKTFESCELW